MPAAFLDVLLIIYSYIMRCDAAPEYLAQLSYSKLAEETSKEKEKRRKENE